MLVISNNSFDAELCCIKVTILKIYLSHKKIGLSRKLLIRYGIGFATGIFVKRQTFEVFLQFL